ncbi:MAG: NfeD family protein [Gammaproteobacteria bacterium]|nr:NfeD family protein [Gammaproteobacteria bacterium]
MIEYIQSNQSGFWIAAGFIMLAAEVLLFGFTTIILMFAGLGALLTGLLMMFGVLPETWIAGTACFGISTGIISTLLWKPLKSMQDKRTPSRKPSSDLIGHEFVVQQNVTTLQPGTYRYSGVDWRVEIDAEAGVDTLEAGQRVTVSSVDAGVFRVRPG